jgi:transposase
MAESSPEVTPITSVIDPDLGAVRQFIEQMLARGAVAALVASILALLTRMRDLNTELVRKLASQSKKRPPNEAMRRLQLELPFLRTPAANEGGAAPSPPPEKPKGKRGAKKRHKHGRPKLPAHLPRVPEVHRLADAERTCPTCQVALKHIGFKTTEKLDLQPAQFIVRQIQCETVGCPKCHEHVRTAPRPDEVVDRGLLGNELLVQATVEHYDNAVPFERMAQSAAQQGVPLSANTLAASVGRLIDLFDPIVRSLREACLSSDYTALDATRMPVLDRAHPLGIRSGALWLVEGAHRYACFFYAPTGHDDHLEKLLEGRTLQSVMCDGSATNNCVERAGGRRGGCNAHGRRKLVEALRGGDERAVEGLALYGAIFHVDAESKRLGETIEQRFARRQSESAPLVDELGAWVERRRLDVEPKSPLGKAIGYLHRQWKRLTAFLRDPTMELTNNEVERDLRRWVLDRKTWFFVGHDRSAERAADALTLITTCKKLGVDPRRYLRDTLAKLLAGEKDLAALLPERYVTSNSPKAADLAA